MTAIVYLNASAGIKRLAVVALVGVVAFSFGAEGESVAKADTLCVGGSGCYATVQAAVNAAQSGDTIRIGRGTFAGGVTISQSVNLVGSSEGRTAISGGGPVLTIGSPTATPTVTLAHLTITGGDTSTDPEAPNCGPDIPTCGPGYPTAEALGGGIEAFPGTTVTILDSAITGNRAVPSVAVQSVHAVCPGNVPCPASEGAGAGIDDWGSMTLIGTSVSDNYAAATQADGGGIAVESGASLSVLGSSVTGNTASAGQPMGRYAAGGGIFVDNGGSLTVDGGSIDANTTSLANSIPTPYPEQAGGGTDQENAFTGGIFLNGDSVATIRNSTLDRNVVTVDTPLGQASGADAALCSCGDGSVAIANSHVDGNTVTANVFSTDANGPSGPAALEADANATITNTRIMGNTVSVTALTSDAAAIGAVGFFFGGTITPAMSNSTISDNSSSASAPEGAATVQGAGLSNNGPLVLTNDRISGNTATASGQSGFAQGGGIFNGLLFGGPTSPLTLQNTSVTGNTLSGSAGITLQGAGIYTVGFPITLTNSVVARNTPDQCDGC